MSEFIKIGKISDINVNSIKPFNVNGIPVAVANLNGEFFAVADTCTHDGGELGEGEVVGECCVECPRHGGRFNLKTGQVKALPPTVPIKTYEVKVEGEDILVKV